MRIASSNLIGSSAEAAPRRGVVMLAVMVVVTILTLAAAPFVLMTMAELKSSVSAVKLAQARAVADAGVHYALAIIASQDNITNYANGNLFSNPDAFRNISVPGIEGATFSIIAAADPNEPNEDGVRYGLTDEGGKINLSAWMVLDTTGTKLYEALAKLPNMPDEGANAIVDWLDADSQPRNNGAESDHYAAKSPPYRAKNGPLDSIEELLLVEGVTSDLLFGSDMNRDGIVGAAEQGSGTSDRGFSAFLTIYSRYLNLSSKNQPLLDINGSDLETLYNQLAANVDNDLAKYIMLYRQYGGTSTTSSGGGSKSGSGSKSGGGSGATMAYSTTQTKSGAITTLKVTQVVGGNKKGNSNLSSLFDLVNSQVSVPAEDPKGQPTVYPSPLNSIDAQRQLLPKLFDTVYVGAKNVSSDGSSSSSATSGTSGGTGTPSSANVESAGRVNVNTAPQEVLATLPGVTDTEVQQIVSARPTLSALGTADPVFQSPAWLLTEANIKVDTLKKFEKYITTKSQVYRVQVIGRIGDGPSARIEAVIDANGGRPRIVFWRDLTEAGGIPKQ